MYIIYTYLHYILYIYLLYYILDILYLPLGLVIINRLQHNYVTQMIQVGCISWFEHLRFLWININEMLMGLCIDVDKRGQIGYRICQPICQPTPENHEDHLGPKSPIFMFVGYLLQRFILQQWCQVQAGNWNSKAPVS